MFERFVGFRYLRSNKGFARVVTWFSLIGIMLGVATLVIVTSVMNGFREDLLSSIVGMKGHIVVTSSSPYNAEKYLEVSDMIKANSLVSSSIPTIEKQAVLLCNGDMNGVMIQSFSKDDLKNKPVIFNNVIAGSRDNFSGNNVLIGKRMAEIRHLNVGDTLSLMIPAGTVTPFGSIPRQESFNVAGIFEVGMIEYDKNILILPLDTAQRFFNMKNKVSQIDVCLQNINDTHKVSKNIVEKLKDANIDGYGVMDWRHSDASIFHAVEVEKNVMTLILSIIILVAVFNIISGLTMLTNSKTRDIAILRTMGAKKSSILKIFFMIGSFIGVFGTLTGVSLGLFISLNIDKIKVFLEKFSNGPLFNEEIYFLSQIPSKTDFVEVAYIVGCSLILCFIATIYPARKAAQLDPAEAFRI